LKQITEQASSTRHRSAQRPARSGSVAAATRPAMPQSARLSSGDGPAGPTARSCGGRAGAGSLADAGTLGSGGDRRLCRSAPWRVGAAGGRWASGSAGCRPARLEHGGVVGVGGAQDPPRSGGRRARRPSAAWTRPCPDRPGWRRSDPPLTARRLKESTLTRCRSTRPASPSSSSRTTCSWSNTPARAHSSNRRQQVIADPQPSSLTGSRLQGVEVRAMKMSAATQLRSGTRRGTPPRGRGGGGGSSDWMRCHSSSGRSRSTRLVMPGAFQDQPQPSSRSGMSSKEGHSQRWICQTNTYTVKRGQCACGAMSNPKE
jgi:hypothetical protein